MKNSQPTRPIVAPKKLIEVALPLDEINKASAREKSIRHGHPSTLHLWWARRPLAAARSVLFAQLVNDPSWKYSEEEQKKPQIKSAITRKRNELFKLITDLVQWENTNNESVLSRARAAIRESWRETCAANADHPDPEVRKLFDPEKLPPFHDPFAGGGSIPLEAQRLGLEAHASDLNPVAVLINKAMIEIPPKFAGRAPVGPIPKGEKQTRAKATEDWSGAKGLAEDVRRYGAWMREEAEKKIGHLYPKVTITKAMVKERPDLEKYQGQELTVIAWLWARTVASPNPAFRDIQVPLTATWFLSTKSGKEVWIEPQIAKSDYFLTVRTRAHRKMPPTTEGTKQGRGANFRCLMSGSPITPQYVKAEANAGRLGQRLITIVAQSEDGRIYLLADSEQQRIALVAKPSWSPRLPMPSNPRWFSPPDYGMPNFADIFTARQLTTLTTLCDLVIEAQQRVRADFEENAIASDRRLADDYANAIAVYLGLGVSKTADYNSSIVTWSISRDQTRNTFGRQAIPMTWDFAEVNPLADAAGNLGVSLAGIAKAIELLPCTPFAKVWQASAQDVADSSLLPIAIKSTDPPYYDNIGYADLSDYFYIWLRKALGEIVPDVFTTVLVPKKEELIATPYRHGSRVAADEFFLTGMQEALKNLQLQSFPGFPTTIYYAFKQSETEEIGTASTGWDSFLQAVLGAGLSVDGTWPMRTEREVRSIGIGTNALASSIVLVCRQRATDASVSRREFIRELERRMPSALAEMTADPIAAIAPVDLAQAAIGPGMAIFSKYKSVLEADGSPMSVHDALIHINKAIDDYFAQAEGDMDADTRFCIGWFQQYGFQPGAFGEADVLARAKGTAVDGVKEAGVIESGKGKVRLLNAKEYPKKWDPQKDDRAPTWEACHQMCRALGESESEAGKLLARMPAQQDNIRQLAYRLYTLCERKGWAEEARAYNELVTSWPAIVEQSQQSQPEPEQKSLF